ncbi:MAG: hypothetical protein PHV28_02800 [Kiritimatiellae bacterium]|nr:hypothetical protein [Kiritimatiellia bacterium]
MVYTYRDTVEALVKVGRDAVPIVLERLNDPACSNVGKKYAIWALVRIGVADPGVIQTLQTLSSDTNCVGVAKYAQDTLRHFKGKNP